MKIFFSALIFIAVPAFLIAAAPNDLKLKIEERSAQIKELEKEIDKYQDEVIRTQNDSRSIDSEVKRIDTTLAKLRADIKITERRLEFSELTIDKIGLNIAETESDLLDSRLFLADLLRRINEATSETLVEVLLAHSSISGFFNEVENLEDTQKSAKNHLDNLREFKIELESELAAREAEKKRYLLLKSELTDRKGIESDTRDEKTNLLKITKKKESEYRALLNDRVSKKEELEAEIRAIEEEIRVSVDSSLLPVSSKGLLGHPLAQVSLKSCVSGIEAVLNCVTQFFGNTDFSTKNPQVYSGNGHNGVDFRASVGAEVFSSYEGSVRATGNTDDQCRGVSYGRWALIDHPNNLSTLYAHLSKISVTAGVEVQKGGRIGYTGQTGYATGPHLHFAVFAKQAVQITSLNPGDKYYYKSRICGTPLYMPISPPNGYLNPLSYL